MLHLSLDQTPSPRRSPRKNTRKLDINTNTEYLKIARKGGGHKGTNIKNNKKRNVIGKLLISVKITMELRVMN